MKRSHLIRDSSLEGLFTLDPYMDKPATNADRIRRMKQLLSTAMELSLTNRQREAVQLYYLEEKKVIDIARELGISRQAVHKLLRLSRNKLQKIKNIF